MLLDKAISHDDVKRFVSQLGCRSKALWEQVKPVVRAAEKELRVTVKSWGASI